MASSLVPTPSSLLSLRTRPSLLPLCPRKASTLPSFPFHLTPTPPPPSLRFRPMIRTPCACDQAPPPSSDHRRPSPDPPTWKKGCLRGMAMIEFALTGFLFSLSRSNGIPLWFSFIVAMALSLYFRAKKEVEAHDTMERVYMMFDMYSESEIEYKRELSKYLQKLQLQMTLLREFVEINTKQSK